jgi:Flp pilus assembly pilin Flp
MTAALHPARSVERRSTGSYRTEEVTAVRARADTRRNFSHLRDARGQAMVEYALILALIAVIAFGLVGAVGDATVDLYTDIGNEIHGFFD